MPPSQTSPRRYDLDWLRVIAFGLLILYHTGMFYVTWDWHVKSVHAGPGIEWLMRLVNPWRLALLFVISGVALRFLADKTGSAARLARERTVRLGLPILFGMAVVVAPQSWLQLTESGEFHGSFLKFWPQYLDPTSHFSIITPTWNHLWYVVYLLVYTLLLAPVAGALSRMMVIQRATAVIFGDRLGVLALLTVPLLPHIVIQLTLEPIFPTTHALVDDWAQHAHNTLLLLTGFLLAKDPHFWGAVRRALPLSLALTFILGTVLTIVWFDRRAFSGAEWAFWDSVRTLYAWLAIVSMLGLAQRWLNRPGRALSYMTEAIFPWYILHQTITVMAGYWLTRQGLPVWIEAPLVIAATFGGCAVLHEYVIRRTPLLRPLFGLKPASRSVRRATPA